MKAGGLRPGEPGGARGGQQPTLSILVTTAVDRRAGGSTQQSPVDAESDRISVSVLGAPGRMGPVMKSGWGDWGSRDEASGGQLSPEPPARRQRPGE